MAKVDLEKTIKVGNIFMSLQGTLMNNHVKIKATSCPLSFQLSIPDCSGIEAVLCSVVLLETLNVC